MRFLLLVGLLSLASAANVCPDYVFSTGESPQCLCAADAECIGKCCPLTGKCSAASCDGNSINKSGQEKECVVDKSGLNKGGRCPWEGQPWGVFCKYIAGCELNKKNNCYGYTSCGAGSCPDTAVGIFCIESGTSDNFKVCACENSDCQVGDWGPWGPCLNWQQVRYRQVTAAQSGTGSQCPHLSETQSCTPDIDCSIGPWADWGKCVGGVQVRTRGVVTVPVGSGQQCPPLFETQSCGDGCQGVVVAKPDFYVTSFNKPVSGNVLSNDNGADSVELVATVPAGSLDLSEDGGFLYTPRLNFCGTESFTYKALGGDCHGTQEAVVTTTCGCGSDVATVECVLDLTQQTTQCQLPGGQVLTVQNRPGHKRVVIKINAKLSYKK